MSAEGMLDALRANATELLEAATEAERRYSLSTSNGEVAALEAIAECLFAYLRYVGSAAIAGVAQIEETLR